MYLHKIVQIYIINIKKKNSIILPERRELLGFQWPWPGPLVYG